MLLPGGAHMENLKKGDIIFNHKQVEELLSNGVVTSNGGHGVMAHATGTAHEMFNAYSVATGGGSFLETGDGGGSEDNISATNANTKATNDNTKSTDDNTKKKKESTSALDKLTGMFDWVAIRLQYFADKTKAIADKITDYISKATKENLLKKQINATKKEITANQKGYDAYIKQANKAAKTGKLSAKDKKKIQEGDYSFGKVSEDKQKAIDAYKQYYDAAQSCKSTVVELQNSQLELFEQLVNMPTEKAEKKIEKLTSKINRLKGAYDLLGSGASTASAYAKTVESDFKTRTVGDAKTERDTAKSDYESAQKAKKSADAKKDTTEESLLKAVKKNKNKVSPALAKKIKKYISQNKKIPKSIYKKLKGSVLSAVKKYNNTFSAASNAGKKVSSAKETLETAEENLADIKTGDVKETENALNNKVVQSKSNYNNAQSQLNQAKTNQKNANKNLSSLSKALKKEAKKKGSKVSASLLKKINSYISSGKAIPSSILKKLKGKVLSDAKKYNAAIKTKAKADSKVSASSKSVSSAKKEYNNAVTDQSNFNSKISEAEKVAIQYKDDKTYVGQNAILDAELSDTKSINDERQKALSSANENVKKSADKVSSANKAKDKANADVKNKANSLLKNKKVTKALNKTQEANMKNGKLVSEKGLKGDVLKKVKAYNKLVTEAKAKASAATLAQQQYNIAVEAQDTALDNAATSQQEYAQMIIENEKTKFNNIKEYYDSQLNYQNALNDAEEKQIALKKAQGKYDDASDYDKQIANQQKNRAIALEEYNKLQAQLSSAEANGIVKGSQEWNELATQVTNASTAVTEIDTTIANLQTEKLDEKYDRLFTRVLDKADQLISKLQAINGLISDDMAYDYETGELTEMGMLSMVLNVKDLNTSTENLKTAVKEREQVLADYKAKYNKDYVQGVDADLDKRMKTADDEINSRLSATKSAQSKILDIVKNQSKAELDALNKTINAHKDALQKKKDYYDWDKTLKNSNKEIQLLEQQVRALDRVTKNCPTYFNGWKALRAS